MDYITFSLIYCIGWVNLGGIAAIFSSKILPGNPEKKEFFVIFPDIRLEYPPFLVEVPHR